MTPSTSGTGSISIGTDPGANITCSAASSVTSPSWFVYSTRLWASNLPRPASDSTPLAPNSAPMPAVSFATTPSL